ncbi:MAG: hypothetical protein JNM56_02180 [Planctomycetia bacterium]|nr:hypothetical protein [Planctomycetia bacterium]
MKTTLPDSPERTAVQNYETFCLAALLVLVVVLLYRGYGMWSLLPLCVGLLGIYSRLSLAPVMLLLSLILQMIFDHWLGGMPRDELLDTADLLQCAAVLGYISAQFRLQGLSRGVLPADPRAGLLRRPTGVPLRGPSQRAVPARELLILLAVIAFWTGAAQLAWAWLPEDLNELGLAPVLWRLVVLLWTLGLAALLAATFLNYLARERMSPAEASLFLQDVWWKESRTEQRRANRWLAWARLRHWRRRESLPPTE